MADDATHNEEHILLGTVASPGVAIGSAYLLKNEDRRSSQDTIDDAEVDKHISLFYEAKETVKNELQDLQKDSFSDEVTDIISAQVEIVNDPELSRQVEQGIRQQNFSADHAIHNAFEVYLKLLAGSPESFANNRSVDISDIRDRLIEAVKNDYTVPKVNETHILIAKELSPRQVIKAAGLKVKGLIIKEGGRDSHAAIIARSVGIPAITGIKDIEKYIAHDDRIAMIASEGKLVVHPSDQTMQEFQKVSSGGFISEEAMHAPFETSDGHSFILKANIGFEEELEKASQAGAQGIGLLRTEAFYMDKGKMDTGSEQEARYLTLLEGTNPHPVTIRLLDAGGDKQLGMDLREKNPFLGWRGIRMLLDKPELLKDQLRAILKAAAKHPERVRILIPMVTNVEEVVEVRKYINEIQAELSKEGIEIDDDIPFGIMVEVPSVALLAESFAKEVDFFSIGTNDLTQYLLAADRGNEKVASRYDQRHPAVWKTIQMVQHAAAKVEIPVSVCGELASDPVAAACMIGLGINELSMGPAGIPKVKTLLHSKKKNEMVALAEEILLCSSLEEVKTKFNNWSW